MKFFQGLVTVTWFYTLLWCFYQYSYAKGAKSHVCPKNGYIFDRAIRFGVVK